MLDLVRAATGSSRGWIALRGGSLGEVATPDLVQVAIGSWSPLEFTYTCRSLEITGHPWKWVQGSVSEMVLETVQLGWGWGYCCGVEGWQGLNCSPVRK